MKQSINERIKQICDYYFAGNTSAMSRAVLVKQSTIRDIIGTKQSKPSFETLKAIVDCPTIKVSADWLLMGTGNVFDESKGYFYFDFEKEVPDVGYIKESPKSTSVQPIPKNVIKYYPSVSGSMGGVQFLDDPEESYVDIIMPGFAECKFAINAYGDSMYPVIKSGQVVLLMEWTERFIDWGRIYLVVTKSGYRTIKYLKPADDANAIRCESENKESNPAFDIDKEDVLKLFLVKGWVCRDTI